MASLGVSFGRALLMVRGSTGVASAVNFYQNGLGMAVVRHTDEWAELTCAIGSSNNNNNNNNNNSNFTTKDTNQPPINFHLSIQAVESESQLSVGYSPFLSFDVDDMDMTVLRCIQMGANLDGPIQYPAHGKVAAIRAPDGHMIGLYEPSTRR
jgi:catechol 2,3-dioxygenase-like lactoylglutathione lyase family enzyme